MIDPNVCLLKSSHDVIKLEKWQQVVDMMSQLFDSASGTLVQYRQNEFNVVSTSSNDNNFLEVGHNWPWDIRSFCRRIMETKSSLYVNNALESDEWKCAPPVSQGPVKSYYGLPLYWPDNQLFGSICIIDIAPTDYSSTLISLLYQFKYIIECDLQHAQDIEQIKSLALTDELTGISNRRGFNFLSNQKIRDGKRFDQYAALLTFDIDNLKYVNDSFGHETGDCLIKLLVSVINRHTREEDVLSRYGGDEFIMLSLVGEVSDIDRVINIVFDDFKRECLSHNAYMNSGVSIGKHVMKCVDIISIEDMIKDSDADMYRQKRKKCIKLPS